MILHHSVIDSTRMNFYSEMMTNNEFSRRWIGRKAQTIFGKPNRKLSHGISLLDFVSVHREHDSFGVATTSISCLESKNGARVNLSQIFDLCSYVTFVNDSYSDCTLQNKVRT